MQELSSFQSTNQAAPLALAPITRTPFAGYLSFSDLRLALLKHIRLIALMFAFSFLGTAGGVFLLINPMYTAEALLLIQPHAPTVLNVQQDLYAPDTLDFSHDYYKSQYQIMRSQILAAKVIRQENLDRNSSFRDMSSIRPLAWARKRLLLHGSREPTTYLDVPSRILGRYDRSLEIYPIAETRLVEIRFTTPYPALSARIANAHAWAYMKMNSSLRGRVTEQAETYMKGKLGELKSRLTLSEVALNDYRRKLGVVDNLDELNNAGDKNNLTLSRLAELDGILTQAEAERIGLEAEYNSVSRGGDYDSMPASDVDNEVRVLRDQLATIEGQYASLSTSFTDEYPDVVALRARIEEVRKRLRKQEADSVKSIELRYREAIERENELRVEVNREKSRLLALKDASVEYAILARDVETNRQLYDSVVGLMKNIGMAAQLPVSNVAMIERAIPPTAPSSPNRVFCLAISAIVGLLGGVCLALLRDSMDDTFEMPHEIEGQLRLPNLAVIPDVLTVRRPLMAARMVAASFEPDENAPGVVDNYMIATRPRGTAISDSSLARITTAEAYRGLRDNILLSRPGSPPRTLLFTSSGSGEGKTTAAVNTAVALAETGARVLVIDAELRNPKCQLLLNSENKSGLTEILAGRRNLDETITAVSSGRFFFLSSGPPSPSPGVLLGSFKMRDVLDHAKKGFDYVLLDSCPVLAVTDTLLLAALVDGVVFIVRAHITPHGIARQSLIRLERAGSRTLGVVLNGIDLQHGKYAYQFKNYYSYHS